jgi:hypothetical protein
MPTPTEICKTATICAERKLLPLIEELQAKVREMEPKVCAYEEQQNRILALEQQVASLMSMITAINHVHSPPVNVYVNQIPAAKPTASGACFRCGRTGHYIESCFAKRDVYGNELD